MNKIIQFIKDKFHIFQDWFQKQTAEEKRRLALICTGVFALFLTIAVLVSLFSKKSEPPNLEPERLMINSPIPAGELFIPEEPDFIPGVLLGREQRSSWTEEDASEYWIDPLRQGEEQWREKIETVINELWERVP